MAPTGSIGESTLDIIKNHPDKYEVVGISANKNYQKLSEQVDQFKPRVVSISDNDSFKNFKNINNSNVKVLNGEDSYDEILDFETDLVVAAITGAIGLNACDQYIEQGNTTRPS